MIPLSIVFTTFCLLFVSELPDKTSIATLVLATKYRVRDVVLGAWAAFLVQTVIGVAAGSILTLLPIQPIRIVSGLGFLLFAYLAFRQKEEPETDLQEEQRASRALAKPRRAGWLVSFLVIFAAEWGDLTQVATAALVAESGHPLAVGLGAVLALWSVTVIVAFAGARLTRYIRPRILTLLSGFLFAVIGLVVLGTALV
jgi:putative Ca2+/H+ antiporter (TMEM165/GDT1 family)